MQKKLEKLAAQKAGKTSPIRLGVQETAQPAQVARHGARWEQSEREENSWCRHRQNKAGDGPAGYSPVSANLSNRNSQRCIGQQHWNESPWLRRFRDPKESKSRRLRPAHRPRQIAYSCQRTNTSMRSENSARAKKIRQEKDPANRKPIWTYKVKKVYEFPGLNAQGRPIMVRCATDSQRRLVATESNSDCSTLACWTANHNAWTGAGSKLSPPKPAAANFNKWWRAWHGFFNGR